MLYNLVDKKNIYILVYIILVFLLNSCVKRLTNKFNYKDKQHGSQLKLRSNDLKKSLFYELLLGDDPQVIKKYFYNRKKTKILKIKSKNFYNILNSKILKSKLSDDIKSSWKRFTILSDYKKYLKCSLEQKINLKLLLNAFYNKVFNFFDKKTHDELLKFLLLYEIYPNIYLKNEPKEILRQTFNLKIHLQKIKDDVNFYEDLFSTHKEFPFLYGLCRGFYREINNIIRTLTYDKLSNQLIQVKKIFDEDTQDRFLKYDLAIRELNIPVNFTVIRRIFIKALIKDYQIKY